MVRYSISSDAKVYIRNGYFEFSAADNIIIEPYQNVLVGTSLKVAIPDGYEGLLYISDYMLQRQLILTNWIGTIDSDYRGEVKFIFKNLSPNKIEITKNDVIGYLVISKYYRYNDKLPLTYPMSDVVVRASSRCSLPVYSTSAASGADLFACIDEPVIIEPLKITSIDTGLDIMIPNSYELQVRPRSGLAAKHQITAIPQFYRGPSYVHLMVYVINLGTEPFVIKPHDRIAQIVLTPFTSFTFQQIPETELDQTKRGEGGFGSTGV